MRCIACLFIACLLVACGKDPKPPVSEAQKTRQVVTDALLFDESSGLVYERGESEPFTGKAVWYHPGGERQQETAYLEGKEHGTEIWWHEDGSRAGQSEYKAGVLDGPTLQWYAGGKQKQFQTLFAKGKQLGREIWWHENGREKLSLIHI